MSDPVLPFERPLGARPTGDASTEFRVWAPRPERIVLRAGGRDHELADAGLGVREAVLPVAPGEDYAYVIEGVEIPDPASRWQPGGLRGPSRVLDTGAFAWTDDGFTAARPRRQRDLRAARRHVHARGHVRGRHPAPARPARARDHHDRAAAGGGVPRRATAGATTASTCRPPTPPTAARCALQRLVDAAHAEGLAVLLDVVYNHVGASGAQALEAFGPYFTEHVRDGVGQGDELRRRPTAAASASGCCRAPRAGSATSTSTGCGSTPSTRSSTAAPSTSCRRSPRACTRSSPRALVIAESGMNDPKVVRSHERGGWGCDAVWADDFHHALRVLLTGDRDGYYAEFGEIGQLAKAYRRPHVHDGGYSTLPRPPLRRARRRRRARALRRLRPEPRPDRQPRVRRPPAARGAPARRAVHAAVAVHADALPGRGARRDRAVPVLRRPHRRGDRGRHARGAAARVRRLRRVRGRGGARPAGPRRRSSAPSSRARASPRGCATSTRACSRRAARSARARRTPTSTSTRAG